MKKIDLHMHTTISDGTDTPEEILERVREAGIEVFSVTDHDAIRACRRIREAMQNLRDESVPGFISGVEFSCRDERGKYHILGYGYDITAKAIRRIVAKGHAFRMEKTLERLEFLEKEFGMVLPEEEKLKLLGLDNPGKPHIGLLLVKLGYAATKEEAIYSYIDKKKVGNVYLEPEEAIAAIRESGGLPVLAHPPLGTGRDHFTGEAMEERLKHLMGYGLEGVEAYYSTFTEEMRQEMLALAEKYHLYVTAGSDYHGYNKPVRLGDTGLTEEGFLTEGLQRFLRDVPRM